MRPPTFHLGWLIDDEVLLRLAKERGIGSSTIDLREYLKDEEFVDFDDESFDEPPEPPNLLHKMLDPRLRLCDEEYSNFGLANDQL